MESLLSAGLLQIPIALGLIASAIFYVIEIWSARQFFKPRPTLRPPFQPPVTVLKPLKGIDVELYENLATFCRQIYPQFEIICGVADPARSGDRGSAPAAARLSAGGAQPGDRPARVRGQLQGLQPPQHVPARQVRRRRAG
jgi:hypothetical protein